MIFSVKEIFLIFCRRIFADPVSLKFQNHFFKKTEKAKLLQVEAQEEMANEDLKTFEKSGNLPKLTPVLFNKRKESDILETHRGNYKRHWETSSR